MKAKVSATEIHKIPLFNAKGKKVESIELDKDVFNGKSNKGLLYQAVNMYRANQRQGTADTKTRAHVRGGGKKPWRQKGTGRARVGSIRSPLWRGGGVVFGPHMRDYRYHAPKKLRRNAFIASLNAKLKSGDLLAIEDISLSAPKTKEIFSVLKGLNLKESVLLLAETIDKNLYLSARNIKNLTLKKMCEATALDVLSNKHVLMTKQATHALNKRIKA